MQEPAVRRRRAERSPHPRRDARWRPRSAHRPRRRRRRIVEPACTISCRVRLRRAPDRRARQRRRCRQRRRAQPRHTGAVAATGRQRDAEQLVRQPVDSCSPAAHAALGRRSARARAAARAPVRAARRSVPRPVRSGSKRAGKQQRQVHATILGAEQPRRSCAGCTTALAAIARIQSFASTCHPLNLPYELRIGLRYTRAGRRARRRNGFISFISLDLDARHRARRGGADRRAVGDERVS